MLMRQSAPLLALLLCVSCAPRTSPQPLATTPPALSASSPAPVAPPDHATPAVEPPPTPPLPVADYEALSPLLDPVIRDICKRYNVTGMSLVAFDASGACYRQSYGYAVLSRGTPADSNTRYRVASVSKAVTAMLALRLVEQGKLTLDGDISEVVGYSVHNPAYPSLPITLRQLLTHTSGVVDSGAFWSAVAGSPVPSVTSVLPRSFDSWAPGEGYCYTNLGMGLVSGVIEGATQQRFIDYTTQQIFATRGIDAAYSYTDIVDIDSVANIYQGGSLSVDLHQWRNMSAKYNKKPIGQLYAVGYGELIITAGDLADIARAMSGHGDADDTLALQPATLSLLNTLQYEHADTTGYPVDEIKRGMGTQITDQLCKGHRMVGHQGNAYGSISAMFWDPQTGTGFVMLTNGAASQANSAGVYLLFAETAEALYSTFWD